MNLRSLLSSLLIVFSMVEMALMNRPLGLRERSFGEYSIILLALAASLMVVGQNLRTRDDHSINPPILWALLALSYYFIGRVTLSGFTFHSFRHWGGVIFWPIFYWIGRRMDRVDVFKIALVCALVTYSIIGFTKENEHIFIMQAFSFACLAMGVNLAIDIALWIFLLVLALTHHSFGGFAAIIFGALSYYSSLQKRYLIGVFFLGVIVVVFDWTNLISTHSVSYRIMFWRDALNHFFAHPWFGQLLSIPYAIPTGEFIPHPHNIALGLLSETGVFGTFLFLGLIATLVAQYRQLPPGALAMLGGFFVWGMIDDPFYWIGPSLCFILSLSIQRQTDATACMESSREDTNRL